MEIRKGRKKHINEECVNMMNIKKEKKLDIEEKNTQEESSNRCKPCESESNDMKYHELRLNGQNAECCVSLKICSFFLTFIVLIIIVFLMSMKSRFSPFLTGGDLPIDGGVFKCIGWLMGRGYVPYRDIFDHKGPALYFVEYLSNYIAPIRGIWVFEFVAILITIICGYLVCRMFNNRIVSVAVLLFSFARYSVCGYGNCIEEFTMPFYMYSILLFLDFFQFPDKYLASGFCRKSFLWAHFKIILFGIGTAIIFWSKCNLAVPVFVFCVGVFVYCIHKRKILSLIWFILAFLVGFLLITLPCLIYISINKAWKDFLYDYFIFNFLYSTNEERVYFYTRIYSINFFVLNIGGITAFASIILCLIKKTERFYFDILYFVFMISVVLLTTMSAQTYLKMEIPILVTYVYPFSQLMNFANKEKNSIAKFTLVLYLSASYMVPLWADMINSSANDISNHFRGKEYNYSEDDLVKYIKDSTEKNDKIIVCGNCCQLYMYTDREPANKYIFLPPLEIEPGIVDEYFYLLADNPPKAIVMESTENELVRRMEEFTKENGYGEMHMENGRLSYPIYIRDDN